MIQKVMSLVGFRRPGGSLGKPTSLPLTSKSAAAAIGAPGRSTLLIQEFRKRLQLPTASAGKPASGPDAATPSTPPVLRSTGQWMSVASLAVCAVLAVWIMFAAWAVLSTGHAISSQRLVVPSLKQYPMLANTRLFSSQALDQDVLRLLSPEEDSLVRVFQNIAAFENARSEEVLRSTPALVQSVVAASPAARAGVMPGDRVIRVNARPADFVWDLYKGITETPQQSIELTLQRGTEPLRVLMELDEDAAFDMTNHGLMFGVPDHIRYLGRTDVSRLAKQVRSTYVNAQPSEWRRAYVDGLVSISQELVANLSSLAAVSIDSKGYVRSEDLLGWYHTRLLDGTESHRTTLARLQAHQSETLFQLGLALWAASLAALVAIAMTIKARWALS